MTEKKKKKKKTKKTYERKPGSLSSLVPGAKALSRTRKKLQDADKY